MNNTNQQVIPSVNDFCLDIGILHANIENIKIIDYKTNPSEIEQITDEEFEANLKYANEQVAEFSSLIKSTLGSKQVRQYKQEMSPYFDRSMMDTLGNKGWMEIFNLFQGIFCSASIIAQYKNSTPAFRSKLTYDVILEKCKTLKLDDHEIKFVMKNCDYMEEYERREAM